MEPKNTVKKPKKNTVKLLATTARVVLYKSKTLADGSHPLMICVTRDRKRKYYSTGISCTVNLWDENKNLPKTGSKGHPQYDFIKSIIDTKMAEYSSTILELRSEGKEFTPESLVEKVEEPSSRKGVSLHTYFKEQITRLRDAGSTGNANTYEDTFRALKNFKKTDIPLSDVSVAFCNKFDANLTSRGVLDTTKSVYFRTLRAVINRAIKVDKLLKPQYYPFNDFKISKFDTTTRHRAIDQKDIRTIEQLELEESSRLFLSRQVFLFIYYCRGINFIDIAKLRWKDFVNGVLTYERSKTGKVFSFRPHPKAVEIIDYWRVTYAGNANDYIFPFLSRTVHIKPDQIMNRVKKKRQQTNADLKEIAKRAKIEANLTSYVGRHTYASTLKANNVPVGTIQESMGHHSETMTNVYLKKIENKALEEADQVL